IEQLEAGTPGRLKVTAKSTESDEIIEGEYNTSSRLGLRSPNANIESFSDPPSRNGKIPVNDEEQTNVPHIYAIGDILEGKWELTPVAIQAGKLLARRLFAGATLKNWGYRVSLRDKNVNYVNAYAEFVEPHKIKATNKRGKEMFYTAAKFVLATGERPRYLGIPGDKEYCITSDDLFSLPYCPGKTLVIGASYVALECGGFLAGLGLDVTVMVLNAAS
ncbi:thioredoxin reductase 1, cytoplasmic-like, partial [Sinocyclocheilus grahami]|uniref:thioredoxin reductase 1, cytoplasmic-like n=1 Tax=Sinocyclocheilus grahami TaxID=75366 RepID=UPI0007AD3FBB